MGANFMEAPHQFPFACGSHVHSIGMPQQVFTSKLFYKEIRTLEVLSSWGLYFDNCYLHITDIKYFLLNKKSMYDIYRISMYVCMRMYVTYKQMPAYMHVYIIQIVKNYNTT